MERWATRPLQISEMLDYMFHIMKKQFSALFLISFILLGPIYLIQGLLFWAGGVSFFRQETDGPWYMVFFDQSIDQIIESLSIPVILSLSGIWLLLSIILLPMTEASILVAMDYIRKGEKIHPFACIKRAFSRFWALLGGSIVYGFTVSAFLFLVSVILAALGGLIWLTDGFSGNTPLLTAVIILMVLLGIAGIIGFIYFSVRLGFYFAVIVFDRVSPGLTQSWNLTRNNFWRAFLMAVIVMMITGIVSGAFEFLFTLLLGYSVFSMLLIDIFYIVIYMLWFVGYGVVFFDLKLRNEGTDLQDMMEEYRQQRDENPVM